MRIPLSSIAVAATPQSRTDAVRILTQPPRNHISILPDDVLETIFTLCVTPTTHRENQVKIRWNFIATASDDSPYIQCSNMAIILSQTCTHWRSLAFALPLLWSTIIILDPQIQHLHRVQFYLKRAGTSVPLFLKLRQTLRLCAGDARRLNQLRTTLQIVDLWVARAQQWKRVEFDLLMTDRLRKLLGLSSDSLRSLEHFRFTHAGWAPDDVKKLMKIFHSAPNLRSFDCSDGPPPETPTEAIRWGQLTNVSMSKLTPRTLFTKILPICGHQLKHLNITALISDLDAPWHPHPEHMQPLPALLSLRFRCRKNYDASVLLNHITIPVLNKLEVLQNHSFQQCNALRDLLARSSNDGLQHLLINGRDMPEIDVLQYMAQAKKHLQNLLTCQLICENFTELVFMIFGLHEPDGGEKDANTQPSYEPTDKPTYTPPLLLAPPSSATSATGAAQLPHGRRGRYLPYPLLTSLTVDRCRLDKTTSIPEVFRARRDFQRPLKIFECRAIYFDRASFQEDEKVLKEMQDTTGLQLTWVVNFCRPGAKMNWFPV